MLQVFAFVAPKIIGGKNAPSPVGELGMVEMSQALDLIDVCYEQVGGDLEFFLKSPSLILCLIPCFILCLYVLYAVSLFFCFRNLFIKF